MENLNKRRGPIIAPLDYINGKELIGTYSLSSTEKEALAAIECDRLLVPGFYLGKLEITKIPEEVQAMIGVNLSLLWKVLYIAGISTLEGSDNANLQYENVPNPMGVDEKGQGIAGFSIGAKKRARMQDIAVGSPDSSITRRGGIIIELDGDQMASDVGSDSKEGARSAKGWSKALDKEIRAIIYKHSYKELSRVTGSDAFGELGGIALVQLYLLIKGSAYDLSMLFTQFLTFTALRMLQMAVHKQWDYCPSAIGLAGFELDKIIALTTILKTRRLIFELTEEESAALHEEE
jgi:hypothetical protein